MIGDLAKMISDGVQVPGVAQGALQGGKHVGKIIASEVRGSPKRQPFRYHDKGNMAAIGRSAAVAQIGKVHLSGFPAWTMWLGIHLVFLVGMRNRIAVFLQWIYAYFTYKRGARIIMGEGTGKPPTPPV